MSNDSGDLFAIWREVVNALPPNQSAWLTQSRPATVHGSTAIIEVPNDFTRQQLEGRLRTQIEFALSQHLGLDIRLAVAVNPELEAQDPAVIMPTPAPAVDSTGRPPGLRAVDPSERAHPDRGAHVASAGDPFAYPQAAPPAHDPHSNTSTYGSIDMSTIHSADRPDNVIDYVPRRQDVRPPTAGETRLNPRYTFESFVIGASNRFPHAAAVAVSEVPGKSYNPLLIYGESGLGKTHLLHAIGHYVRSLYPSAKVRYVSSEEFTNEFINAIRDEGKDKFKQRYREVDVLLIDDIQFLQGKDATQEEFFHTFNALHTAGKQIVLTSDKPPKLLEALEDRLRNRFEWGLMTDVQAPEFETRRAILEKKAQMERLTVPRDVLEFIASKIHTNIRELEGALIRVTAYANLNRQEVDLSLAEIVLKDLIPEGAEPEITASLIIAQTAAYFSISLDDLIGPSRGRQLVLARQIAMYLCRELTDMSLPAIGKEFGRDHTTVMYANNKIMGLLAERRAVYNQVTELTNRTKMNARQNGGSK